MIENSMAYAAKDLIKELEEDMKIKFYNVEYMNHNVSINDGYDTISLHQSNDAMLSCNFSDVRKTRKIDLRRWGETPEKLNLHADRILSIIHKEIRNKIGITEIVPPDVKIALEEIITEFFRANFKFHYENFYSWNHCYSGVARSYITFPTHLGVRSMRVAVERESENHLIMDFDIFGKHSTKKVGDIEFESTYGIETIRNYLSRYVRNFCREFFKRFDNREPLFD